MWPVTMNGNFRAPASRHLGMGRNAFRPNMISKFHPSVRLSQEAPSISPYCERNAARCSPIGGIMNIATRSFVYLRTPSARLDHSWSPPYSWLSHNLLVWGEQYVPHEEACTLYYSLWLNSQQNPVIFTTVSFVKRQMLSVYFLPRKLTLFFFQFS